MVQGLSDVEINIPLVPVTYILGPHCHTAATEVLNFSASFMEGTKG